LQVLNLLEVLLQDLYVLLHAALQLTAASPVRVCPAGIFEAETPAGV